MSRIVRSIVENCVASDLPAHVREAIEGDHDVTVRIEDGATGTRLMKFRGLGAHRRTTIEEAVGRIRALRDDWD